MSIVSFFLFFLSSNIFVSFVFIALFPTWQLAGVLFSSLCFSLVLFLTGRYNFCFPLFARSIYCTLFCWTVLILLMDVYVQFSSVAQSCPTLCNPMNYSRPGFPVLHYLPEFAQIHVQWVSDAIQPSHPASLLLLPSVVPSSRVSELPLHIKWSKCCSFSFSVSPSNEYSGLISLGVTGLILLSEGLSRVFSRITIQKLQFIGAQPSLWSNSHICTWLLENHSFDYTGLCWQSDVSAF